MKLKFICFQLGFFLLANLKISHAQSQEDNWYFGNKAAVSFTTGSPLVVSTSAMVANEGGASISDASGNLLFYTNGISVWNKNNSVMSNGTGLSADVYSGQPAVIVKKPGFENLFYLFTMNTWEFSATNLKYSIVDMSLNGGLGDVTSTKNILVNSNVREQLTAVAHGNGQDYWIVVHEGLNQKFLAYRLTSSGLDTVPVVSTLGMNYTGTNRFGCLRFSQNCNKLASVLGSTSAVNETIQIYDFNNQTGEISNAQTLATYADIPGAYSCEFSPDGSKLYVTSYNLPKIFQYDLNAGNIALSKTDITNGIPGTKCGLDLARDGKIYVSMVSTPYLSVINKPDSLGMSCGFQNNFLNLGHNCTLALSNNYSLSCSSVSSISKEEKIADEIQIYPNPSSGFFTLEATKLSGNVELSIFNYLGEKMYSTFIEGENGINKELRPGLPHGIYFVIVRDENVRRSKKLIIQ